MARPPQEVIPDNWIIENIERAFATWNEKLAELWSLIAESPADFKGGDIWQVMESINGLMKGVGYGLLVLFTAISIFGSTANFRDFKRPEHALRHFIRFVAAKTAVGYAMDLILMLYGICAGTVSKMAVYVGGANGAAVDLPSSIKSAIDDVGFWASIPLWIVSLLGSLGITVISFILIMTVYSRFFKLYMYTALAPIPLSTFAGESTSSHGKAFIKSYIGVCMEGAVIVLSCIIFGAFVSGPPTVSGTEAVTIVYGYLAETIFNMLVLVGLIKGSDRIVKEMFGL